MSEHILWETINEQKERIAELELQLNHEKNLNKVLEDNNEQLRKLIEKLKICEICEHGGNVGRICYSNELCNNRDKWQLSHRLSERKEYRK